MENYVLNILNWYLNNKRALPWRENKNPYHIWISEIMLQQTRVEAVIHHYQQFIKELPTINDLAHVDDDKLLKLWEGLGYYNRARNLKRTAKIICDKYQGLFPQTYDEILQLPGIGEYTASAISSICFNEKQVTIDGNIMRIFTRFYNDTSNISKISTKRKIQKKLLSIIPNQSGDFNEGLMEIGERICTPSGVPKCEKCPLKHGCLAYKNTNYFLFPIKDEKKEKEIVPLTVMILVYNDKTFIQKRKELGLLHHLFEFPNIPGIKSREEIFTLASSYGKVSKVEKSITYTHIFTHKKWEMHSYIIFLESVYDKSLFLSYENIEKNYALPTAFQVFLSTLKNTLEKK